MISFMMLLLSAATSFSLDVPEPYLECRTHFALVDDGFTLSAQTAWTERSLAKDLGESFYSHFSRYSYDPISIRDGLVYMAECRWKNPR